MKHINNMKAAIRAALVAGAIAALPGCTVISINVDGSGGQGGTAAGGNGSAPDSTGAGGGGQPSASSQGTGSFLPEISHAVKELSIQDVPRLPIVYFNPGTTEADWKWQVFTDLKLTAEYTGPIILDVEAAADVERQRLLWMRKLLPKAKLVLYTCEHFLAEADAYAVAVWPHVPWEQARKWLEAALATGKPVTAFINCRAPEDQAPDVREKRFTDDQLYRRAADIASLRGSNGAKVGVTFWTADYYNLSMKHAPIVQEVQAQGDRELVYLRRMHAHVIEVMRAGRTGQQQPAAFKPTAKGSRAPGD
jgi:hypothetical protein